MRNIRNYDAQKYENGDYIKVEEGIYKTFLKREKSTKFREATELETELIKNENWEAFKSSSSIFTLEFNNKKYLKKDSKVFIEDEKLEEIYVTSLTFSQEPELGENDNTQVISQYPLEDILDKFSCFCVDSYHRENLMDKDMCYQEFGSHILENIRNLRSIIGKHVYNNSDNEYVELVIED